MRKLFAAALTAVTAVTLAASAASAQTFVGFWQVDQGPNWTVVPQAYSAREAAALLFGGLPTDYLISSVDNNPTNINNSAWYSTWDSGGLGLCGGAFPCGTVYNHDFVVSTGGLYQNPGDVSAYTHDWAVGAQYTNYAFTNTNTVPEPSTVALLGVGMLAAFGMARRRQRSNTTA